MIAPKITVRKVAKSYQTDGGEVRALAATDLSIAPGEFVSIVGPSGCGKSTLIYVVAGFIKADGEVHRVEARTEPLSQSIVPSRGDVAAVLELAAGSAGPPISSPSTGSPSAGPTRSPCSSGVAS